LFVGLDVEQSVSQLEKSMTEGGQTVLMMDKTRDKLFFFLLSPPPPATSFVSKHTRRAAMRGRQTLSMVFEFPMSLFAV
jgi:hypothetical protein